jgi:3-oxoacyl-[acyl-carrier protein] reductase
LSPASKRSLCPRLSMSYLLGKGATILSCVENRLQDRVAIVTGGGHGIGRAYAQRLAEEGAKVVIAELDAPAGERVAAELGGLAVRTDVADEADCERMARLALERFGRIDILVNNAAIFHTVPMSRAPFDEIDPSEWDRMMAVNLRGTWFACRAVVPQMRKQRYGKIVNISSGTALKGTGSRIHYVTSKAGILGFTRTLAMELGKDNICVNCIAPGSTLSEEDPDEAVVKYRQAAASTRALQRMQKPEDLVGAVAFFASPDSDFITGQTLVVDGGACMH